MIWTTLQTFVMISSTKEHNLQYIVCGVYVFYMTCIHQPRQFNRLKPPYFRSYTGSPIQKADADTIAWVVPSLLAQPILYAVFLYFS